MATVFIPPLLRDVTGGEARVQVTGATLRQVINSLEEQHPGVKARLMDGDRINPALGVVVDGVNARMGLITPVKAESEIHFLPAISGGARRYP